MKSLLLLLLTNVLLTSCNFGGDSSDTSGGGLFSGSKPTSTSFSYNLPSNNTYTSGEQLDFILTHSYSLVVVGTPRLVLTIGSNTRYAEILSGNNTKNLTFRYTVTAGDSDLDGINISSTLDLNGGSIKFTANGIESDVNTNLGPINSSQILIGDPPPQITNLIEPINATYAEGSKLLFQVSFEEDVAITGLPQIALNIGGQTKYAQYSSGSGTSGIEFSYTIGALENDLDGISIVSNSIELNGGTIATVSNGITPSLIFLSFKDSTSGVIVNTSTGITPPDQVPSLSTAPTTSNTTLSVSWSVPNNNGTPITNYSLQYRISGNATWINISPNPTVNSTSVSGLVEGTTYEFRVAANNGLLGPYSNINSAEIFSILDLNPIAWLSATNVSNGGTEPNDGDKVSSWSDLTGTASPATESTPANQPTYKTNIQNGLPAIRFDAHTRGLEGTFTRVNNSGLTVFIVGKMDQNTSRKCFFEFYSTTITRRGFFFNYGFNEATTNFHLDDTGFNLWTAYDDGAKTDFWQNENVIYTDRTNWGPTGFTGAGAYVLGDDQTSGDQISGYLGEFLIFDKQLTPSETSKINTYLRNKWGTP